VPEPAAGLLIAACVFLLPEPPRRGKLTQGKSLPILTVLREIWTRRAVYLPLMLGLALTSLEVGGLQAWRPAFMMRTYGWSPAQVGAWIGIIGLIAFPIGTIVGTALTEWLGKRHRDAPVRTTAIVFGLCVPFSIASPLMPTGELALIFGALAGVFGFAAAVPQNVAIQTVTPNEMRGQVTAVYLFMFIVFGALGSSFLPLVTTYVAGGEERLWLAMALVASLLPIAAWVISLGMRPYAAEIERLEAKGVI
jgi:MFS family permease